MGLQRLRNIFTTNLPVSEICPPGFDLKEQNLVIRFQICGRSDGREDRAAIVTPWSRERGNWHQVGSWVIGDTSRTVHLPIAPLISHDGG